MDEQPGGEHKRSFKEEIEIAGSELVERVKALIAEGRARVLRIRAADGDVRLEIPLTVGAVTGGVVTLAAPWLAVLGVLAALVTRVTVEIVKDVDGDGGTAPPPPAAQS